MTPATPGARYGLPYLCMGSQPTSLPPAIAVTLKLCALRELLQQSINGHAFRKGWERCLAASELPRACTLFEGLDFVEDPFLALLCH